MNKYKLVYVALLLVTAFFGLSATAEAQYAGRSIGASGTVNGTNFVFADTGALPSTGGIITVSAPSSLIPQVMSTGVLTASTAAALRSSLSITVANDVDIVVGGVRIQANRVTANSNCICSLEADSGTCDGSVAINGLSITDRAGNVSTVTVTGPNQIVTLPDGVGTLTLNQQQLSPAGIILVNGIRVDAASDGTAYTLTVASALSGIACLSGVVTGPTPADVTVSGRVLDRTGRAISRASVSLTDANGTVRTAISNTMGYYSFAEIEAGTSVVLQASARGYTFSSKVVNVEEDTTVNLVAN